MNANCTYIAHLPAWPARRRVRTARGATADQTDSEGRRARDRETEHRHWPGPVSNGGGARFSRRPRRDADPGPAVSYVSNTAAAAPSVPPAVPDAPWPEADRTCRRCPAISYPSTCSADADRQVRDTRPGFSREPFGKPQSVMNKRVSIFDRT